MSIEIKNVTKNFGKTTALDNVSLTFEENRIYGLLGNNGAGKTTLLNLISNRLFPNTGEVLLDGESVENNDRALGRIYMMSEANLYPEDMRIKEAIKYSHIFYPNFDSEYALKLAEQFHLKCSKKITALSTGQSTIFRLIIALSTNVEYLFLDEPVLGMDASNRDLFYRLLLEKYAENPFCAIISTHLIQEIENLTEHTVIIKNGKVIADADNDVLKENCFCISGPATLVDNFTSGKEIIFENRIGGLKSVSVRGKCPAEPLVQGLEISNISMQDYFIQLMNEEDKSNE